MEMKKYWGKNLHFKEWEPSHSSPIKMIRQVGGLHEEIFSFLINWAEIFQSISQKLTSQIMNDYHENYQNSILLNMVTMPE